MIRLEAATVFATPLPGAREERKILGPVDFAASAGQSHLLLGRNGSGKTTLIRVLSGLVPLASGRYLLDGRAVEAGSEGRSLWPDVAALFEEPDPQFLADTVEAEVAFGVESLDLSAGEVRERTAQALREFGLREVAGRAPHTLSAGEKARALLAAAMAGRPRCLILDQSLSHLDPGSRRMLEERVVREAIAGGRIVIRTHQEADPPFAGETLHVLDERTVRDASRLTPWAIVSATRVPFPLALRVSALLKLQGKWEGPLAVDLSRVATTLGVSGSGEADMVASPTAPPETGTVRQPSASTALAFAGVSWAPLRHKGPPIVEGVDLGIARGEVVAVIGRSGSGKSTLLKLAAGVLQPTAGALHREAPPVPRTRPVSLTMEYPERQLFGRTVLEDVAALLWVDGVPAAERDQSARRAMAEVGLAPDTFADRFPLSLSEGEKRRTALAGALAEPPHVLLLDEPTAGLDPEGRRSLAAVVRALRERGRTVVFASHDLDFVGMVADRAVVLAREEGGVGRVLGEGAAQVVLRDRSLLDRAGLPPPDFVVMERVLRSAGMLPRDSVTDQESLLDGLARVGIGAPGAGAPTRSRSR